MAKMKVKRPRATIPTTAERSESGVGPLTLKSRGTREWVLQSLSLAKASLAMAESINTAKRVIKNLKESDSHLVIGYRTFQEMLNAEGISSMLKAVQIVAKKKENPDLTVKEVAEQVACSKSHAAKVCKDAGLKAPTFKEIILRDHIKPDGTLHIGGEKASQREVAKVVGCDQTVVRDAVRGNSSSGKTPHPAPSPAMKKVLVLLPKLTNGEVIELIGLAKARLGGL